MHWFGVTGGSDYVAINEAFTINPGETRCFNLTIVDDPDPECTTESFNIELTNVGSPLVCSHSITLHIKDNEEGKWVNCSYCSTP